MGLLGRLGGPALMSAQSLRAPVNTRLSNPLATPADGSQYLFVNMFDPSVTGGVYQDMGPMIPNHTYTLTVAIGSRKDRINSPGIISLVNGTDNTGTVLATGGGLPATQDTWQDYTVTYTTGPTVSGDLTICLSVLAMRQPFRRILTMCGWIPCRQF